MDACALGDVSERISDLSAATLTSSTSWRCAAPADASAPSEFQIRSSRRRPDATPSSNPTSRSPTLAFQVEIHQFQSL